MRSRFVVVGALAGGVVLFAWQTISHGALGLPEMGMRELPNDTTAAAAHSVRALATTNGVYFSRFGLLAAVDISPDFADKTKQFVPMMLKQLMLDLGVVLVLTVFVSRLASRSVVQTGLSYGLLALLFGGLVFVSNGIWWNFPAPWTLGNVADQVIGFFLVGITLGALHKRFGEPRIDTAERPGVRAQGNVPMSESGVRAVH